MSGYTWNGTKTICPDQIAGNRDFEKVELKCKKQCLTTHAITLSQSGEPNYLINIFNLINLTNVGKPRCLPERLKSTFFEKNSNVVLILVFELIVKP